MSQILFRGFYLVSLTCNRYSDQQSLADLTSSLKYFATLCAASKLTILLRFVSRGLVACVVITLGMLCRHFCYHVKRAVCIHHYHDSHHSNTRQAAGQQGTLQPARRGGPSPVACCAKPAPGRVHGPSAIPGPCYTPLSHPPSPNSALRCLSPSTLIEWVSVAL